MDDKQMTLSELQDIILWQQFNKQLIAMKEQGSSIKKEHQKYIQKFCFDNQFFPRVTEDSLIDEIPLSLFTNLFDMCFISYNSTSWNNCIIRLITDAYVLNIEQALADTFDALAEYDDKYQLIDHEDNGDNDEELYHFIYEYNELREKQGKSFTGILFELYELKGKSIQNIIENYDHKPHLDLNENVLALGFEKSEKRAEIEKNYSDTFCQQAISTIEERMIATRVFNNMEIFNLLENKRAEENLKPSIAEFIDHETTLLLKESELLSGFNQQLIDFRPQLSKKLNRPETFFIKVCNISPFYFLKYPMPVV